MTTPLPTPSTRPRVHLYSTDNAGDPKATVLYWGPAGSAKSHNCATWPSPLVIAWCDNLDTWLKFPHIPVIVPGGPDATYIERVADWRPGLLQAIQNRELTELVHENAESLATNDGVADPELVKFFENYTVETLALDDFSGLARAYHHVLMDKAGTDKRGRKKLDYGDWATYKSWFDFDVLTLTGAARPWSKKESYNIVGAVHEREVMHTDAEGNERLLKIVPTIQGQAADELPSRFNTTLVTRVRTRSVPDRVTKTVGEVPEFWCHTLPPNQYQDARDGRGGGGGRFKQLPSQLEGTYPSLAKAWGIEEK